MGLLLTRHGLLSTCNCVGLARRLTVSALCYVCDGLLINVVLGFDLDLQRSRQRRLGSSRKQESSGRLTLFDQEGNGLLTAFLHKLYVGQGFRTSCCRVYSEYGDLTLV